MRNLLLNIGYDGADYHGWQVQKNAVTVQEVFQNAVEKVFGARLPVKGCSRTDSGVHANCYFVSFQTELSIACDGVVRALNTPLDFHPRYCCREKEYVYKLYNGAIRDPFLLRYAYQYRYPIRLERMQQGAKAFLGTHDFRGFCSARSDVEDTVRTITAFTVERQGDMVLFKVRADGFLYNMVRILVGTLLFVSEGKIDPVDLPAIIESGAVPEPGGVRPGRLKDVNRKAVLLWKRKTGRRFGGNASAKKIKKYAGSYGLCWLCCWRQL